MMIIAADSRMTLLALLGDSDCCEMVYILKVK